MAPVSSFSADWLSRREPADARARSARLTDAVAEALAHTGPVRILDLAAGTGSNIRYLLNRFGVRPDCLLVDHDEALLDVARSSVAGPISTLVADLSDLEQMEGLVAGRDLVTASALLDLVSAGWLLRLLTRCREVGATVLFALSYDGRIECAPEDSEDARIRDLVNRHQRGDKGFGPALGPEAPARAAEMLARLGYDAIRERSDWRLDPRSHELQSQLIEGWAEAATEMTPPDADVIAAWRQRRLAHVHSQSSSLLVGHEDVAGCLR